MSAPLATNDRSISVRPEPLARCILPATAIVLAGCLVFSPAFNGGWIWDDHMYVAENPALRSIGGLKSIWFAPQGVNYFPLTFTVQWIQWHLWGGSTFGYHLTNVALHIVTGLLFWRLLLKLRGKPTGPARSRNRFGAEWLGGMLFVVHPLAVESVAWISELKNALSLPLLLSAMIAYVEWDERKRFYGWSVILFVAAMLSKSTVAMFPCVLLLYAWWKRGRLALADAVRSLPFFAVSAVLGRITLYFEHHRAIEAAGASADGLAARVAGAGTALAFYFGKSLVPVGTQLSYPRWPIDTASPWPYLPWLVLVGAFGLMWAKRERWGRNAAFGIGSFVLNLIPVLGLIPMAYMRISRVADHFAYPSLLGVTGLAALGCGELMARLQPIASRCAAAGVAAVCLLMAMEGRRHAAAFVDEQTYWSTVLAQNPSSWLAENHLGSILLRQGPPEQAIARFEQALRLNADYVEAHNNLGLALANVGKLSEAVAHYRQALRLRPDYAEANANLGTALTKLGDWEGAAAEYRAALRTEPRMPGLHSDLGNVLMHANQTEAAVDQYYEELRIEPDNPAAQNNLGLALNRLGRLSEAMEHYRAALRLKPEYPQALTNLGNALFKSGRRLEAIGQYKEALRIAPEYAPALENLRYALRFTTPDEMSGFRSVK